MSIALHGKRILVTREEKRAEEFSNRITEHGGMPVEVPLLKITCKDSPVEASALRNLNEFKWIFFTSANGVHCFFKLLKKYGTAILKDCKFAVTGRKTASVLETFGYKASLVPKVYNAETLAEDFLSITDDKEPVLLVRGNKSRTVLPDLFKQHSIAFRTIEVYTTSFNYLARSELSQALESNHLDFLTFTSPSAVEAFYELSDKQSLVDNVVVCIGTTTGQRATELGMTNILIPEDFTIDGMLKEISDFIERG